MPPKATCDNTGKKQEVMNLGLSESDLGGGENALSPRGRAQDRFLSNVVY